MSTAELNRIVDAFVAELEDVVRRQALAAIQQVIQQAGGAAIVRRSAPAPAPRAAAGTRPAAKPAPQTTKGGGAAPKVAKPAAKPSSKFVRRSPEEVNATADKIYDYVKRNPNVRAEQIKTALGIATNAWLTPIAKLLDGGRLATKGQKRSTTYSAR